MAKVTGPLFSFGASGTVGKKLTYRATKRGAVVQTRPIPSKPANSNQIRERSRFSEAMATWKTLDAPTRAKWVTVGLRSAIPAYKAYTRQYIIQQSTPDKLPLIPA